MKKIRVLIVEDSQVIRELLTYIIGLDPRLHVAGAVESGEEALRVLESVSADVISLDIRLPGMNGFETTRRIMSARPTPIVVVAASVQSEDLKITVNALQAGALAVLEKPVGPTSAKYGLLAERLCTQLVIMSQVNVVRRHPENRSTTPLEPRCLEPHMTARRGDFKMLGIVSSTGGPNALAQVLGSLPSDFPLPILLVQHIGGVFLDGFARWLDSVCPFSVKLVKGTEAPLRGSVYLASEDRHLRINGDQLEAGISEPVGRQRPSGTVLFESMASMLGKQALGVLLTGMGSDGARGLLKIREAGGYTIAEDESTAVVYGMPAEAVRLGGVCESLPLPAIAPRILQLAGIAREGRRSA